MICSRHLRAFPWRVGFTCYSAHMLRGSGCDQGDRTSSVGDRCNFCKMGIKLGDEFPNFNAPTTIGDIQFHDWMEKDSWAILFSHPADFTPVCTTELGRVLKLLPEFKKRHVKVIALSCDDVKSHNDWSKDIQDYVGEKGVFPYPIISDPKRDLAVQLGMLDPEEKDAAGLPLTARAVFIIGPDRKLKLSLLYPATTGRNFDEILRVIDSLQLTATKKVATPEGWVQGGKCMVLPSVKQDELPSLFPKGVEVRSVPSGKPYLRFTEQP